MQVEFSLAPFSISRLVEISLTRPTHERTTDLPSHEFKLPFFSFDNSVPILYVLFCSCIKREKEPTPTTKSVLSLINIKDTPSAVQDLCPTYDSLMAAFLNQGL